MPNAFLAKPQFIWQLNQVQLLKVLAIKELSYSSFLTGMLGYQKIVKALIDSGANVQSTDDEGNTALGE